MDILLGAALALIKVTICHLGVAVELTYRELFTALETNLGHSFAHVEPQMA